MNILKMFKMSKNTMLIGVAVIAIIIVGVLILADGKSFSIPGFGKSDDAKAKIAIEYLNKNVLSGQTASLEGVSRESGLIKIKLKIGETAYDSYISNDGKLLFAQAIEIKAGDEKAAAGTDTTDTTKETAKTCEDLKKTDKAELEAFVVSQCPFGLQMQRVLADVVKNAPALASNIKVRYMGEVANGKITSMHGDKEAQENLKQICIREEQASKYWAYVSCYMKAGETDSCLTSTGIDKAKLTKCTTDANKGLAYAKVDFDLNTKYSVTGSPTLILNGESVSEFDFGGRTSDALKSVICCGSKTQDASCSKTLSKESAASSFSETYSSGTGSTGAANCGS